MLLMSQSRCDSDRYAPRRSHVVCLSLLLCLCLALSLQVVSALTLEITHTNTNQTQSFVYDAPTFLIAGNQTFQIVSPLVIAFPDFDGFVCMFCLLWLCSIFNFNSFWLLVCQSMCWMRIVSVFLCLSLLKYFCNTNRIITTHYYFKIKSYV